MSDRPANPAPSPAGQTQDGTQTPAAAPARTRKGRTRLLLISVPLILILAGLYFWLSGGRYESTENAQLHQARMLIASDLSGRIADVPIADNQHVKAGDILFKLDDQPWRLALDQADAAVTAAQLQVKQLQGAYASAQSQRSLAQEDLDFVTTDTDRQQQLRNRGVASVASLDQSRHDLQRARDALTAADVGVQSAAAALAGAPDAPIDSHPLVVQALAARAKAAYTLEQTVLRAPVNGLITQAASFQKGQFVTAGSPLFSLIATDDAWVDANFKETQLDAIDPGQTATVVFDAFPGDTYQATVQAIGAGTGAEFALLPAQNATGNWVKVTQRVPVRVHLDAGQNIDRLRAGLSATVTVDTGRTSKLDQIVNRVDGAATADGVAPATDTAVPAK
ncbi:MAG: HlyD family secretion protein [Paracoccus denitrificans]|nr:MAG: HlyD family secretion protein [Paracoccus denitrificans]PZO82966.1 MAG: HlyD family secretion protein [Paracoccus denitrificans]